MVGISFCNGIMATIPNPQAPVSLRTGNSHCIALVALPSLPLMFTLMITLGITICFLLSNRFIILTSPPRFSYIYFPVVIVYTYFKMYLCLKANFYLRRREPLVENGTTGSFLRYVHWLESKSRTKNPSKDSHKNVRNPTD